MTETIIPLHEPTSAAADNAEWRQTVDTLREAVNRRQKDALTRVGYFVRRLEQELGPHVSTLAIMQSRERTGQPVDETKLAITNDKIALLRARLDDLRSITSRVRRTMRDDDDGPTVETALKGAETSIQDMPEALRTAAEDLRSGWLIRLPSALHSKAVSLEHNPPGKGEYGQAGEILEEQYLGWFRSMTKLGIALWPVDDVVCRGRSYAESAKLHRTDLQVVRLMVFAGLTQYQFMYPPLDRPKPSGV